MKCENVICVEDFLSLVIKVMKMLREKGKLNVLRDFVKCLGFRRLYFNELLMLVDRMLFGLI